jgi:acyl carrier protein
MSSIDNSDNYIDSNMYVNGNGKPSILERIQLIVADLLNVEPEQVVPSANFTEDLGADSLDVVELVMAIEEEFALEIDDRIASEIETVQDVLDYFISIGLVD